MLRRSQGGTCPAAEGGAPQPSKPGPKIASHPRWDENNIVPSCGGGTRRGGTRPRRRAMLCNFPNQALKFPPILDATNITSCPHARAGSTGRGPGRGEEYARRSLMKITFYPSKSMKIRSQTFVLMRGAGLDGEGPGRGGGRCAPNRAGDAPQPARRGQPLRLETTRALGMPHGFKHPSCGMLKHPSCGPLGMLPSFSVSKAVGCPTAFEAERPRR